jgi:hypothetical protein
MEIQWSAPEYHHYRKDVGWYWLVLIITAVIAAFALWQKNFLFAVFIAIAAVLVLSWGRRAPKTIDFTLSEKGLDIGGRKFYRYETLLGFAIIPVPDDPELNELALQTKGRLNTWLKIIIADQRSEEIKELLSKFLPELEYEESLADHIARILRF